MSDSYDIQDGDSDEIKIRKIEARAAERREAQRAELFKWFVILVWTPIASAIPAYFNNRAITQVAERADSVEKIAKTELVPAANMSAAINTAWKAERSGAPEDVARAVEAKSKVDSMMP